MKSITVAMVLMTYSLLTWAQVTDNEIVKSALGRAYPQLHKSLDSLGVWYAFHVDNDQSKSQRGVVDAKKVYSISDGNGSTKVWVFVLNKTTNVVDEIVVNYRHDSRQQVEDSRRLRDFTDFHVGLYSTDYVFRRRK